MTPGEGNRLKCWIIPEEEDALAENLEKLCYTWIETHLSPPERPKHITIKNRPPVNEMGKISDWPINPSFPSNNYL